MRMIRTGSTLLIALMVSGCVSMSKYNEKVQEVAMLRGDIPTLEANLTKSEAAGKALQGELQKNRENLARLEQEHENLKAEYVALTAEKENANLAMGDRRHEFSSDMEALTARLNESETRSKSSPHYSWPRKKRRKRFPNCRLRWQTAKKESVISMPPSAH